MMMYGMRVSQLTTELDWRIVLSGFAVLLAIIGYLIEISRPGGDE